MTEKQSIPIKNGDTISSTSQGIVHSTWNPVEGQHREDQIREARAEAWRQHQKAQSDTIADRLDILELKLQALEREVLRGKE
jgi:hypothetical protein